MKNFRISDDGGVPQEVQIEVQPTFVSAFDTTNDSFSCVLKATSREKPYAPMSRFYYQNDDDPAYLSHSMYIINDSVSVFSLKPKTYKHTLTMVQNRYKYNKHLLRNTVFNQPKKAKQTMYLATSTKYDSVREHEWNYKAYRENNTLMKCWNDRISINSHTKLKSAAVKASLYGHYLVRTTGPDWELVKINDINTLSIGNAALKNNVTVEVFDANNSDYVIYTFNAFDYINNSAPDLNFVNTINNYTQEHTNLYLAMRLVVNGVRASADGFELSFAEAINTGVDPQGYNLKLFNVLCFQFEIEVELYNYTMYDVLETLNNQNRLLSENYPAKRDNLIYLPAQGTDLYNLLKTTYAPDTISFTQATWYDALTEIFRFFDAGFRIGPSGALEIEYYNDYVEERTDLKYTGKSLALSDKEFNNGKVLYYQNAVQELSIENLTTRCSDIGIPGSSDFAIVLPKPIYDINKLTFNYSSTYTGDVYEILGSDSRVNLQLDLTHFVVNKEIWSTLDKAATTILPYAGDKLVQNGTIPFERGSKEISVSTYQKSWSGQSRRILEQVVLLAWYRFFGIPNSTETFDTYIDNWMKQRYNIDYLTSISGRAEVQSVTRKYNGEEIVNQGDGLIDLNKMGLNILGESLKNGEPTLTASCKITNWDDRPKEGQYVTIDNVRWLINVVNMTDLGNGAYKCNLELSKNFNALSLRVRTDNQKRLTAISSEETIVSEDNYIDYVYVLDGTMTSGNTIPLGIDNIDEMLKTTFSYKLPVSEKSSQREALDSVFEQDQEWQGLVNIDIPGINKMDIIEYQVKFFEGSTQYESYDVQSSFVSVAQYDGYVRFNVSVTLYGQVQPEMVEAQIVYKIAGSHKTIDVATITPEDIGLAYDDVYIPMMKYGFGNCICFELQMDHPISAGNLLTLTGSITWQGPDSYFSQVVPYTDDDGWVDTITIDFYHITDYGRNTEIGIYPILQQNTYINGQAIPLMELLGGIWKLHYYKKPNEVFALNYQWCFLSRDPTNFFIGSKFINENSVTQLSKMPTKKFYLKYRTNTDKYSILDIKGEGTSVDVTFETELLSVISQTKLKIITAGTINANSWAIVDENNDIYFASNNAATFTNDPSTTKFLTFITRRNRI